FQLRVALWVLLLVFPFLIVLAFAPSRTLALVCIAVVSFLAPVPRALTATCIQAVTPNRMRGVMAGLHIVTVNVVGLALGPTSVAFATDVVFADGNAVGLSLSLVGCVACVAGAALIAPALRPLADLLNAQSMTTTT
ncbi:MAG: MFS transporter, partial [Halieaceae bacterium]